MSESNNNINKTSERLSGEDRLVKDKVRVVFKKYLKYEIEELKDILRKTYALEVKKSMDKELNAEEEKLIEEKAVNLAMVDRLQEMSGRFDQFKYKKFHRRPHVTQEVTLLHFFYLVRLAQQGFFQLITGVCPDIEPQAIAYLCDKLVGLSLRVTRSEDVEIIRSSKRELEILLDKMYYGDLEPIGEGFKTTFKQIRDAADALADEKLQKDSNAEPSNGQKLSQNTMSNQLPPVWIVMPYTSMLDGSSLGMPGLINNLSGQLPSSFPTELLIPPQTVSVSRTTSEDDVEETKGESEEVAEEEKIKVEQENLTDNIQANNVTEESTSTADKEEEEVELVKEEESIKMEEASENEVNKTADESPLTTSVNQTINVREDIIWADDLDDERFEDPDIDDTIDTPIQPSVLDSFLDESSLDESNIQTPDSPMPTDSKPEWNDSVNGAMEEETNTQDSPRSSDSRTKVSIEDTANTDWKNFRPTNQSDRSKSSPRRNNQNKRRSQGSSKDNNRRK